MVMQTIPPAAPDPVLVRAVKAFYYHAQVIEVGRELELGRGFALQMLAAHKVVEIAERSADAPAGDGPMPNVADAPPPPDTTPPPVETAGKHQHHRR